MALQQKRLLQAYDRKESDANGIKEEKGPVKPHEPFTETNKNNHAGHNGKQVIPIVYPYRPRIQKDIAQATASNRRYKARKSNAKKVELLTGSRRGSRDGKHHRANQINNIKRLHGDYSSSCGLSLLISSKSFSMFSVY